MKGRVEVTGPNGSASLALVSKDARSISSMVRISSQALDRNVHVGSEIEPPDTRFPVAWVWKLVASSAQRDFLELNAETLYELIVELSPS